MSLRVENLKGKKVKGGKKVIKGEKKVVPIFFFRKPSHTQAPTTHRCTG